MNNLENFLIQAMNLQPEHAHTLSYVLGLLCFAIVVGLFVGLAVNSMIVVPFSLDRLSERISKSERECSELRIELHTEVRAREALERKFRDLEGKHARELHELRSDVEGIKRVMPENRESSIPLANRYRPSRYS